MASSTIPEQVFAGLHRASEKLPIADSDTRMALTLGGIGALIAVGTLALTKKSLVRAAVFAGAFLLARQASRPLVDWTPPMPPPREENSAARAELQKRYEARVPSQWSDAPTKLTTVRTARQSVPEEMAAENTRCRAALSSADREKLEACWTEAKASLEALCRSVGIEPKFTHELQLVNPQWSLPGTYGVVSGLALCALSDADGHSSMFLRTDCLSQASKQELVEAFAHELCHSELSFNQLKFRTVTKDIGTGRFAIRTMERQVVTGNTGLNFGAGLNGSVTGGTTAAGRGGERDQAFREASYRFDEAATDFLAAVATGRAPNSRYRPSTLRLTAFYKNLPEDKRNDFVRTLVHAKLEGSFKRLYEYFIAEGAPANTRAEKKAIMDALLALDFRLIQPHFNAA